MLFDVREPGLSGERALLYGQIRDAHRQLRQTVEQMTDAELAYAGPRGTDNSSLSILLHLAFADAYLGRLATGMEVPDHLKQRLGPPRDEAKRLPKPGPELGRDQILALIEEVHGHVRAALERMGDHDLDRTMPFGRQDEATARWVLWHMADHTMLHLGQIRLLLQQARGR